ncbi:MAG: hypothetical protein Ct9H300mP11_26750 [Chloroflexota bacterium]|nr:MAG: hypothetical protein Ct9H300mP11_26750 [Chloroflexota bacterium]
MSFKKLRLIHTSDTHLGDVTGHPQAADALISVVDAVADNEGDMLLLVGDVFDNERVSDEVLDSFLTQIARFDTPALVLPGNHDLIHETFPSTGVRPFKMLRKTCSSLKGAEGEVLSFPDLGIDFFGARGMPMHTPAFKPLQGMPPHWQQLARGDGSWSFSLR